MASLAMNVDTYLQQCAMPPMPSQTRLGKKCKDGLMDAPPGLSVPMPCKLFRSGFKSSCVSKASTDECSCTPPGVWSFASTVSTTSSSPQRRLTPGMFRTGSSMSSTPSTPKGTSPDASLSLEEQTQAFYFELLQKTSQLQQAAEKDWDCMSYRYDSDFSVSPCRSPTRKLASQPRVFLPLASLVGMEACPMLADGSCLSSETSSPCRGRSPKKGMKAKQPAPIVDPPPSTEGLPSRGSKNHEKGQCRPCRDFSMGKGCANGVLCNFCHCDHFELNTCGGGSCNKKCQQKTRTDAVPKEAPLQTTIAFRPPPGLTLAPPPGL